MHKSSRLYRLVEERLDGTLADLVAARRPTTSWRDIASDIATTTGIEVSYETLRLWFVGDRPEVRTYRPQIPAAEKQLAVDLHTQHGLTVSEIRVQLRRNHATVRGWLKDAGVLRPRQWKPRHGGEPTKHERVAEAIRDQIRSGQLKPGDKLPSTKQLMKQHEVGYGTLRTAVVTLTDEGLIEGRWGPSGRYVR